MNVGMVLLALWLILGAAGFCYLYRHRIRRWWHADVIERAAPPHQRWPEILHWQKGDDFNGLSIHLRATICRLVSIGEDGYAAVDWYGDPKERAWVHLKYLVGHNTSLQTRRVNEDLKQSDQYMELIRQFNVAYAELQERDKKMRLVS